MPDLKIGRIEPARVSPGRTEWNKDRRQSRQDARQGRSSSYHALLASILPGRDPDTCEIDYAVNEQGDLVAVIVRDTRSGAVIARVPAGILANLGARQSAAGLLFERRG